MRNRVAAALAGIIVALLLGEVLAWLRGDRICIEEPGAFIVADPQVGWTHRPGVHGMIGSCADGSAPPLALEVSPRGLLDPDRPYEKPDNVRRILVLGGSYPEGMGVRRESTVGRGIEGMADPDRGARLEVINAAVSGWALDNDLQYLRTEGAKYHPDMVMVFVKASWDMVTIWPPLANALGARVPRKAYFFPDGDRLTPPEWPPDTTPPAPAPPPAGALESSALYRYLRGVPAPKGAALAMLDPTARPSLGLERDRTHARLLAQNLVRALRDESAQLGARLVIVIGPEEAASTAVADDFIQLAGALTVPTIDLRKRFNWIEDKLGGGWLLGHRYWDHEGHALASLAIWTALTEGNLLPSGVVSSPALAGGIMPRTPLPSSDPLRLLWDARATAPVLVLLWGGIATALLWIEGILPALVRPAWAGLLGVGLLAVLISPAVALSGAMAAALWWVAVESLPRTARRIALPLAGLVWMAGSVAIAVVWIPADARVAHYLLSLAGTVPLLRLISYAIDRSHTPTARLDLFTFLSAVFFPPTLFAGPLFSPVLLARHRQAPEPVAWSKLLGALPLGLVAVLALVAAPQFLSRDTGAVLASGGAALSRSRLWLWLFEPGILILITLWGWTTLGRVHAAFAGVSLAPDVRAPWMARGIGEFWRHAWISMSAWLHAYVFVPAGGAARRGLATLLAFAAGGLWSAWTAVTLFGAPLVLPRALASVLVSALLSAVVRVAAPRAATGPQQWLQLPVIFVVVALTTLPMLAQPFGTLAQVAQVWLRLVGIR